MNLLAVVWDFDPTFINIFGFEIRWYSLTWVAALLFGGWLFSYFCKREGKPEKKSTDLVENKCLHGGFIESVFLLNHHCAVVAEYNADNS